MKLSQDLIDYPRDLFTALIDNDSPFAFYLFQWVPYQTEAKRWRLKMCHDVRTFDGREAFGIWPNGDHCGPFKDEEVEFIRISKEQHGRAWKDPRKDPAVPTMFTGPARTEPGEHATDVQKAVIAEAERWRTHVTALLKGIDKTETDDEAGWWDTGAGVKFGKSILQKIIDGPDTVPLNTN